MKDGIFEEGDIVRYNLDGEWHYAEVCYIEKGYINCCLCENEYSVGSEINLSPDKAEYVEPTYFSVDKLKKFLRCEITYDEMTGSLHPYDLAKCEGMVSLEAEDMLALLKNIKKVGFKAFKKERFDFIYYPFSDYIKRFCWDESDAEDKEYRHLYSELKFVWDIWFDFEDFIWNGFYADDEVLLSDLTLVDEWISDVEKLISERSLPAAEKSYPDYAKMHYIKSFHSDYQLSTASEEELALFVKFTEDLCKEKEPKAMEIKAYACYGGNRAYECNWFTSRDLLLELMKISPDIYYANTLGYIYYYGRCNDGKPEYAKAFKYYNIGAADGVYESRYKLADMYLHGYYVAKNFEIAKSILLEMYDQNLKYILKNKLDCKFADVALRVANLYKESYPNYAYRFYLQADFAIRMRLKSFDRYGDASVAEGISKAIDEILPETDYEKKCNTVKFGNFDWFFNGAYKKHRHVEMKIRKLKEGYSLTFRIIPKGDDKYPLKFFLTLPQAHYCGLVDKIALKASADTVIKLNGRKFKDGAATVVFDETDKGNSFMFYGNEVASIHGDITYKVKSPAKEISHTFASVVFNPNGKRYDYICDVPDAKTGDKVIVETSRGQTEVEIVKIFEKTESETALPINKYKHILKKA